MNQVQNWERKNLLRYLYSSALYLTNNADDAQKLAQATLERVYKDVDHVQSSNAFRSWTRQILRNEYKNWCHNKSKSEEVPPD